MDSVLKFLIKLQADEGNVLSVARQTSQQLDDYESQESFRLEFVDPLSAIRANRSVANSPYSPVMFEREARVLEILIAEGLLQ